MLCPKHKEGRRNTELGRVNGRKAKKKSAMVELIAPTDSEILYARSQSPSTNKPTFVFLVKPEFKPSRLCHREGIRSQSQNAKHLEAHPMLEVAGGGRAEGIMASVCVFNAANDPVKERRAGELTCRSSSL